MKWLIVACALVAGCDSSTRTVVSNGPAETPSPTHGGLKRDRSAAVPEPTDGTETSYGETVSFEALYSVEPVAGGKRFQGSWLTRPDGSRLIASYRPQPEYFAYQGKRVVVTGRPVHHGPNVQQIAASHFDVKSMELAKSETPYATKPTAILAPPLVDGRAALEKQLSAPTAPANLGEMKPSKSLEPATGWVRLAGRLRKIEPDEHDYMGTVTVVFGDGTLVVGNDVVIAPFKPLLGKLITVTTRDVVHSDAGWRFGGQHKLCPGAAARCVDDYQKRR